MPRASRLGEKIEKKYSAEIEYVKGSGGVYDIEVDGVLIFSKHTSKRFPEDDEIFEELESR
ncbi:MAG: Rdx family protein [Desulfobulbaceae bacterium]|nr:Rdx family protein [Desulfobulbaceae bacterium]